MKIIDEKIKQIYGDKSAFYDKMGFDYKNGARKINQFLNKIPPINEFLSNLNLKIKIVEIEPKNDKVETDKK